MMTPFVSWISILFGATVILVTLSLLLLRRGSNEGSYSTPARFFLVALRLAIGWHFYVEGMEKLHSATWSSEAYLREATGPLADTFHSLAGDRLVDRLTVAANPRDESDAGSRLSPQLDMEWQAYFDAFVRHYAIEGEQLTLARAAFDKQRSKAVAQFTTEEEEVQKASAYPPALKLWLTVPQRLVEHGRLEEQVQLAESVLPSADPDRLKRYRDAKADLGKWRAELKKTLETQTTQLKVALKGVLKTEQATETTALPEPVRLSMVQWDMLDWSDAAVTWGLIVLGSALLLGVFSRLASALGGLLVLTFYLAMPPLPGWPESPKLEGHYLLINKTLIEAIALGALTFIPTGRWAGLDGLLQFALPRRNENRGT